MGKLDVVLWFAKVRRGIRSSSFAFRLVLYVLLLISLAMLFGGCSSGDSGDDSSLVCTTANAPVLQLLNVTGSPCGDDTGSIRVGTAGQGNVSFSIDGLSFQASGLFESLEAGPYRVVAKNEASCLTEMQVTVNSDISFSELVLPIIQTDCAISGCHVTGAQTPDLSIRSNIFSAATRIKNQVETRNMPRERTLTSTEIQDIICWFNDGAPDN